MARARRPPEPRAAWPGLAVVRPPVAKLEPPPLAYFGPAHQGLRSHLKKSLLPAARPALTKRTPAPRRKRAEQVLLH